MFNNNINSINYLWNFVGGECNSLSLGYVRVNVLLEIGLEMGEDVG